MVEYETPGQTYFTFTNRTAKPDAGGYVSLFRLPSDASLATSLYIDVLVLIAAVASQFYPATRHLAAQALFALQGVHLFLKLRFAWKPVQVHAQSLTGAFDGRTSLHTEHMAFLVSLAFVLGQLLEGADGFGIVLCMAQLLMALVALARTRPARPSLLD